MTDYAQELVPPDYRNLAINPSGEISVAATWFSSNGSVTTGSTAVTPMSGTGCTEYTVTQNTSLPYYFAPFGPNESVHHGGFKIPRARTISASTNVRSTVDTYVTLQAQFYVWNGTQLSPIATRSIGTTNIVIFPPSETGGYVEQTRVDVYVTDASTGSVDPNNSAVFIPSAAAGDLDPIDSSVFNATGLSVGDAFVTGPATGAPDPANPNIFIPSDTAGAVDTTDPNVFNVVGVSTGEVYVTGGATGSLDPDDSTVFDTIPAGGTGDPADPSVFIATESVDGTGTQTGSSDAVRIVGGATTWTHLNSFYDSSIIPDGATHWSLLISVAGSDPAGSVGAAPTIGTKVYADQTMVPDSGANLPNVPYVDGNVAGAYWEGVPYYSTSRTGTVIAASIDAPAPPAIKTPPASGTNGPPISLQLPSIPPVAPPTAPAEPLVVYVAPRTSQEVAQDIVAWKYIGRDFCLKSDVQLGNLQLNAIDDDEVLWLVSDVEGWWTLPEPDIPDLPRGWFDGSYETRGRYNARVFTVTGSFIPSHPASVPTARNRLIEALNLCHHGDWFLAHEDATEARTDTKGSKVWLSGAPSISTVNQTGRTDFSIGLRAPDPIKYRLKGGVPPGYESMNLKTLGTIQYPGRGYPRKYPMVYPDTIFGMTDGVAMNYGNTIVWPTLTLKGPTQGPVVITNAQTNQKLRVVKKLNPSEELVMNCFTKEVTLNGVGNYRFYLDIDVDWLMLQPGPNRMFFQEETPSSLKTELEVLWRSGWIG